MQTAYIDTEQFSLTVSMPPEQEYVLPGMVWGPVAAPMSPAFWLYQVLRERVTEGVVKNRLGNTLLEEVGACLLGGHGIPAYVGVEAFKVLREKGAFSGEQHSTERLYGWLSEPMTIGDKSIRYRFAKQKAKYLNSAISKLTSESAPLGSGLELRNWLTEIKGVGLKTASWVARNFLNSNDVAILDVHIYRAGLKCGLFNADKKIETHYLELERRFVEFSEAMGVKTSELDGVIWRYLALRSSGTIGSSKSSSKRERQRELQVA